MDVVLAYVDVTALIDELLEHGCDDPVAIAHRVAQRVTDEQKLSEWERQLAGRVSERIGARRRRPWTPADVTRSSDAIAQAATRRDGTRELHLGFLDRHADALVQHELKQRVFVPSAGGFVMRGYVTHAQQTEVVEVRRQNARRHEAWGDFEERLLELIPQDGTVGDVATSTLREVFETKP